MNVIEKVCVQICEKIVRTSFGEDKHILNHSVKLIHNSKTAEVVLITDEGEYTFLLDTPKEDISIENGIHFDHCSKCASDGKYNFKQINIKGFEAIELGKLDLEHLKGILEKLAEEHLRYIEEINLEKKNFKIGLYSVSEPFINILCNILHEENEDDIGKSRFLEGIKSIERSFEFKSDEYVYVYGNILQRKIFVKEISDDQRWYKILHFGAEQNIPLVYDVLLTVFLFTDQNMRQYYFHQLLEHYYASLQKSFQKFRLDITKLLPLVTFQKQINEFLPHVKVNILQYLCHAFAKDIGKANKDVLEQHKRNIWTSIREINECILYPNLSRENCYKIIKREVGSGNYSLLNFELIPLQKREGFLGDYFKLKISIKYNNEEKLLQLFAKYLPTYDDMAKELAGSSFKKEEFYYLKFVPKLIALGLEDITNFLPKCYFSRMNEVIILEDMFVKNCKNVHISIPYTYEMLSITVKQLAKIHACSLIYEELSSQQAGELIRIDTEYPEYIEEMTVTKTKDTLIKKFYLCSIDTCLKMLTFYPDIPKKLSMEEFQRRARLVFDLSFEKVKKSGKFRNVLGQGDCWSSNILFKMENDTLTGDCCIVDYQLIRYCPPSQDILFLLFMATIKETRRKFEFNLLQEYYLELSNILQKYKIDLQEIYTYEKFLDCCKYMKSQAVCHSIILLQFLLYPEEKLKPILEDKEETKRLYYVNRDRFLEELKNNVNYSQRIRELIEELYEICESDFP